MIIIINNDECKKCVHRNRATMIVRLIYFNTVCSYRTRSTTHSNYKYLDLISTVITINDEPNWIVKEEEADYTASELLSDTGGSLSLVLGLR